MHNKQVKQINKAYNKTIKALHKEFLKKQDNGFKLCLEYFKYIRDIMFISSPKTSEQTLLQISAIIAAVAEFEAFERCLEQKDDKQKFHWDNFWNIVQQNMGEWLLTNDTV